MTQPDQSSRLQALSPHFQAFPFCESTVDGVFQLQNVWFQKISIPTQRRIIGNSEGERSQKTKYLKESMNQNWKWWGRVHTKTTFLGEVWIFSGTIQLARARLNNNQIAPFEVLWTLIAFGIHSTISQW